MPFGRPIHSEALERSTDAVLDFDDDDTGVFRGGRPVASGIAGSQTAQFSLVVGWTSNPGFKQRCEAAVHENWRDFEMVG